MNGGINTPEETEVMPHHYVIEVDTGYDNVVYENVSAFQVEDKLLKLADGGSTYLIPMDNSMSYVKITPVYTQGEETYVTIP